MRIVDVAIVMLIASSVVVAQESRPFPGAHPLLAAGPMPGHASETEVLIWVQTTKAARVAIRCEAIGEPAFTSQTKDVATDADHAFTAHVRLSGLPFGRRFAYDLLLDGEKVTLPERPSFQTPAHWRFRTAPPDLTVAFGSCSFINEETFDRPGRPYGGETTIFRAVADLRPDMMLWIGDATYYREPDWTSAAAMRRRWSYDRRLADLQPLLWSTHHYAVWDDHDFGPDNSDWTFAGRKDALAVFRDYWANPGYGLDEAPGVFFRFAWSDVEFFMLDDRYERSPNAAPDDGTKTMFGERQFRWLLDSLTSSQATFKIVVNGNQMLNPRIPHESFGHFAKERDRLLEGLAERKITGVIMLSGDRHHAELIRLERKDAYPLYDFTSSPMTSGMHIADGDKDNPARVEGTLVDKRRNFGVLRFAGAANERRVELECRGDTGERLWSKTITSAELR